MSSALATLLLAATAYVALMLVDKIHEAERIAFENSN